MNKPASQQAFFIGASHETPDSHSAHHHAGGLFARPQEAQRQSLSDQSHVPSELNYEPV